MRLTVSTLKVTRGRNWNRCAHCGKMLHPMDRIFFELPQDDLWCSVRCAEADKLPLARLGN